MTYTTEEDRMLALARRRVDQVRDLGVDEEQAEKIDEILIIIALLQASEHAEGRAKSILKGRVMAELY